MALDDCHDGYRWLRLLGYEPDQIVLGGDSAGGYLALSLAQRLLRRMVCGKRSGNVLHAPGAAEV